jgi:hypothetical protein
MIYPCLFLCGLAGKLIQEAEICALKLTIQILTLSDPTSNLAQQYHFPVPLQCRKTSDTVFVVFVRPLSEPVRRFSSFNTDFSRQMAQVVLFLILYVFLF